MHFLALAVRVRGHCYRLNGMSLSDSVFKQALASPAAKTMIETGPTGRAGHRNQQIRLFVDDATIPGDALVRAVTLLFWSEPDMHVALILAARKSAKLTEVSEHVLRLGHPAFYDRFDPSERLIHRADFRPFAHLGEDLHLSLVRSGHKLGAYFREEQQTVEE